MLKLVFILISLCIVLSHSKVCKKKSFSRISVWIQEENRERYQIINGCITSDNLRYNSDALKKVRVSNQNFSTLKKGAVANISANFTLQISHNPNFTTIMEEAFLDLPNVFEVDLNDNMIDWIETNTFSNQLFLAAIDLSKNQLEILLHQTFYNVPNLEIIDFSGNKFQFFDQYWFYNATRLSMMLLHHNRISSIPRASFITLPSLTDIDFENNQISYIHKLAFEGLQSLQSLDLEKNKLKSIELDFFQTPNLNFLGIGENEITYISDQTLSGLQTSLRSLWIHFNPWQCSCIQKVLNWGALYNINVSFKCNNTSLFCVVPKVSENECTELTEEDFHSNCLKEFKGICQKLHS
ncbi:hypothetical protein RI129_009598 [Pyrocoelia pectoralis]|uniref:Uncharacterized protein n=1 Tax=Pyrocoelia pectoralis TaxID=417401 RepID=A0AAN7V8T3_9COLE